MKHSLLPTLIASGLLPLAGHAALIGIENFDYPDGSIAGLTGGVGWTHETNNEVNAPPQTASDWDAAFGSPQVVSSTLVTDNSGAIRQFGGITEGTGDNSNEREGAIRGAGTLFVSSSFTVASMLPDGENQWAGISAHDFGDEKMFFGMPGQSSETRYFGLTLGGANPNVLSTIPIVGGQTYTLVGMIDFDNDLAALWVNPDGSDTVSSYDASLEFASNNWLTAFRWASGSSVTWDDVRVGTTFGDVVPEPASAVMFVCALGFGAFRRRR